MRRPWFVETSRLALLAAGLLPLPISCGPAGSGAPSVREGPAFESYSSTELGVSLSKPKGWGVTVGRDALFVREPSGPAGIFLFPVYRTAPGTRAVSFLRFVYDQALAERPDMAIEERKANGDDTLAEVTVRFTGAETKGAMRGFYVVSIEQGTGLFCGYEAPAERFDRSHEALRQALGTLRISTLTFYQASRSGKVAAAGRAEAPVALPPTIEVDSLQPRLTPDRTMFMAVPPGWRFEGGNYSLVATSPDGAMGVTATNDGQPATKDPHTYLTKALLPFYRCSGTTLHRREANEAVMAFSRSQGYSSKAENFVLETTNGEGRRVLCWLMVNGATLPHGGGFVNTIGFFAAPELFERNSGILHAIAASTGPNQQEIMRVLRENLGRLDSASRTISATGDVVIQGLRSHTATWDRAMDKYNYYLSGQEARYSPLENRVYVVDSKLEKYAGNPRYPQESLTDVPDQRWNSLLHER